MASSAQHELAAPACLTFRVTPKCQRGLGVRRRVPRPASLLGCPTVPHAPTGADPAAGPPRPPRSAPAPPSRPGSPRTRSCGPSPTAPTPTSRCPRSSAPDGSRPGTPPSRPSSRSGPSAGRASTTRSSPSPRTGRPSRSTRTSSTCCGSGSTSCSGCGCPPTPRPTRPSGSPARSSGRAPRASSTRCSAGSANGPSRTGPRPSPRPTAALAALAVRHSHPEWVVAALRASLLGPRARDPRDRRRRAHRPARGDNEPPRVHLVARPGLSTIDDLTSAADAEPSRTSPIGAVLRSGDPGRIAAVRDGRAAVQDEGSQHLALALAAVDVPDGLPARWLDLCAGPGGKAGVLGALAVQSGVDLTAVEVSPHRADLVRSGLALVIRAGRGRRSHASRSAPPTAGRWGRTSRAPTPGCSSTHPAPGWARSGGGPRRAGGASRPTSPRWARSSAPSWRRRSTPSLPAGSWPTRRAARTSPRRASSSPTC